MKISYLILLGFLMVLILFTITTSINFRQAEKVNENSDFFAKSTVTVKHSNRYQRNILGMVSGLRGYLFTGEMNFLQSYDSAAQENDIILKELEVMVADNQIQAGSLKKIKMLHDRWLNEFALPLIEAKKASESSDSSARAFNLMYREKLLSGTEKNINNRLQQQIRNFANYEYDLRDERKTVLEGSIQRTRYVSFLLTSISVALGIFIAIFLAFRISTRIMKMVNMADEIARGNYAVHVEDEGNDELSGLASSLNHMSAVLAENISLLKRKNQELDQFAHIVSHDLKAPLRGIDNVVTWIEEDHSHEISPKVQEYLKLIKGRIVRAENFIRGILSYARVDKDQQTKEIVSSFQLLSEIIETIPVKPGIRINLQPSLPELNTERLPLQLIFSNLLTNAINYHDKTDGTVDVYFKDHPNHVEFFVADNGPGIAKHYHEKIFQIFQTLAERDQIESTGVGLAIVKKILDERKQTIRVVSEPGKGSTFVFTWPKN
jgi:signal transduction histidine kinase